MYMKLPLIIMIKTMNDKCLNICTEMFQAIHTLVNE